MNFFVILKQIIWKFLFTLASENLKKPFVKAHVRYFQHSSLLHSTKGKYNVKKKKNTTHLKTSTIKFIWWHDFNTSQADDWFLVAPVMLVTTNINLSSFSHLKPSIRSVNPPSIYNYSSSCLVNSFCCRPVTNLSNLRALTFLLHLHRRLLITSKNSSHISISSLNIPVFLLTTFIDKLILGTSPSKVFLITLFRCHLFHFCFLNNTVWSERNIQDGHLFCNCGSIIHKKIRLISLWL